MLIHMSLINNWKSMIFFKYNLCSCHILQPIEWKKIQIDWNTESIYNKKIMLIFLTAHVRDVLNKNMNFQWRPGKYLKNFVCSFRKMLNSFIQVKCFGCILHLKEITCKVHGWIAGHDCYDMLIIDLFHASGHFVFGT